MTRQREVHTFKFGHFTIKIIDAFTPYVKWELLQRGRIIEQGEHTNAHDAYNDAMTALDKHDENGDRWSVDYE